MCRCGYNANPACMVVTYAELATVRNLCCTHRRSGRPVFSCNPWGEIWTADNYGWSKPERRIPLNGRSTLAERLWAVFHERRRCCGRVQVDPQGAYFVCQFRVEHQIAVFITQEHLPSLIHSLVQRLTTSHV